VSIVVGRLGGLRLGFGGCGFEGGAGYGEVLEESAAVHSGL
jgi:hypothetical protein